MMQIKSFYTERGIFCDKDKDHLFDGIKGSIYIHEYAGTTEKLVALNLLARLSYECTAMSIDNIRFFENKKDIGENNIVIEIDQEARLGEDETEIYILENNLRIQSKSENALKENGKYIYGRMPYLWEVEKSKATLEDFESALMKAGVVEASIEKILLSSRYEGIKNIYITTKATDLAEIEAQIRELFKEFPMLKSITMKKTHEEGMNNASMVALEETTCENTNFQGRPHIHELEESKALKQMELTDLFSISGIYSDSENDFMNNRMNVKIAVDKNLSNTMVKAVGNIVVRTALDCLELKLDLVVDKAAVGRNNIIEIIDNGKASGKMWVDKLCNKIIIEGSDAAVLKLSQHVSKEYPFIDGDKTVQINDLNELFKKILKGENYQGQLVRLESSMINKKDAQNFQLYTDLAGIKNGEALEKAIMEKYKSKKVEILDYKKEDIIWTEVYEPEWEVDVFTKVMNEEVYPLLKAGDQVRIHGCLSEEKEVRDHLAKKIKGEISQIGATLLGSNIYSSYKQGFSWISEKVIPELKLCGKPEQIIIKFKPFMPEGSTVWFDENGATPTTSKVLEDDENRWFDLPIRFLQELYPADDIIANELGIDRKDILFEADKDLVDTYEISCFADGKEIYKDTGITRVSERPYLDEFPELGKVHPTTGWITVYVNEEKIIDKRIKTDLENIWDFYQGTALDQAKKYILQKGQGTVCKEDQPFFKELRIEAEISDLDYKLPTRKDLISSLDAFHEDLHFVGADFFKFLGLKVSGAIIAEPGLILPVVRKRNGKGPKVTVTIARELYDNPKIFVDGEELLIEKKMASDIKIDNVEYINEEIQINFKVNSRDYEQLSSYGSLVNSKIIQDITYNSTVNICFENVDTGDETVIKRCSNTLRNEKKHLDNNRLNTDSLIGYEDYINMMGELKDVKKIKSYVASKSYQGRDVYTIEMFDEELNDIVSRAKFINYKPVCFINSRHHANEVSSTNAAFDLVKCLINDDWYKHYLEKLNIVIIPFENPDGGFMHYELQKDNPEWKTHVARFNSLGKETTAEWFNLETKHTEALAFTKTWFKWLPDLVTDNHGVPSHEWDQQFSGYVSPGFKGFWLPRALYYGYFWYITDEEYTVNNVGVCNRIQDRLSALINSDEEITKWNIDWANRFEKYANAWMPKMFPADYYKNLIYYWIPFDTKKNPRYSSHKYPNITSVDWTTEVSDETATGEYLKLCAKAHLKGCEAAMDSVISLNNKAEIFDYEKNGQIVLNKKRKRPLHL